MLARLKAAEERAWEQAFSHHVTTGRQGPTQAANRAWRDLQRLFPRLKRYKGARP